MGFASRLAALSLLLSLGALPGCQKPADLHDHRAVIEPILPQRIELVAPLTQPSSFDADAVPEGLHAVLRPTDAQGDAVKLAGRVVFELYTFHPASADPKGDLIQTWTHDVATAKDQELYWNQITRMYEFPLRLPVGDIPRRPKFVLRARYITPWDVHIEDEATLDFTELLARTKRELGGAKATKS
jgi:hypothetical protein